MSPTPPHPETARPVAEARLVAPRAELATCVRAFYWRDLPALSLGQRLTHVPPNPYVALVWLIEGGAQLVACAGKNVSRALPPVFWAGAHRYPYRSLALPSYRSFGVVFHPAALALLCDSPSPQPSDHIADAHDMLPPDWHPLLQAVDRADTHAQRIALCEDFLAPRWACIGQRQPGWPLLSAQHWRRPAQAACFALFNWTQRHWQRRTRQLTGMSPGEIERLLRIERAMLTLRDEQTGCAEAAQAHGYTDQSHFTREARAVYRYSPVRLLKRLRTSRPEDDEGDWLLRL